MDGKERAKRFLLARTGLNQNGEEGKMLVYKHTGVPSSALVAYENPESTRALNVGYVQRLADHYGVNAAWLLGQSESWSLENDLRQICDMTGLSPDAVRALQNLMEDEERRRMINALLASSEFSRIVLTLGTIRESADREMSGQPVEYAKAVRLMEGGQDMILSEGDYRDLKIWQACREIEKLMRSLAGVDW